MPRLEGRASVRGGGRVRGDGADRVRGDRSPCRVILRTVRLAARSGLGSKSRSLRRARGSAAPALLTNRHTGDPMSTELEDEVARPVVAVAANVGADSGSLIGSRDA